MMQRIWKNQTGQDTMEYALMAAFAASCIAAISPAILATADCLGRSTAVLKMLLDMTAQ